MLVGVRGGGVGGGEPAAILREPVRISSVEAHHAISCLLESRTAEGRVQRMHYGEREGFQFFHRELPPACIVHYLYFFTSFSGMGSIPPKVQGWQRKMRFMAR